MWLHAERPGTGLFHLWRKRMRYGGNAILEDASVYLMSSAIRIHLRASPKAFHVFSASSCAHQSPLNVILDGRLERGRIGADNLADLLAVFEEEECRHRPDAKLLRDIRNVVDVELIEAGGGVNVREPVPKR